MHGRKQISQVLYMCGGSARCMGGNRSHRYCICVVAQLDAWEETDLTGIVDCATYVFLYLCRISIPFLPEFRSFKSAIL